MGYYAKLSKTWQHLYFLMFLQHEDNCSCLRTVVDMEMEKATQELWVVTFCVNVTEGGCNGRAAWKCS